MSKRRANLDKDSLFDAEDINPGPEAGLRGKFLVPPFTVLNAREGWWQARKTDWVRLGIKSEVGRGAPIGGSLLPADRAKNAAKAESFRCNGPGGLGARYGKAGAIPGGGTGKNSAYMFRTDDGYDTGDDAQSAGTGTSIFDPVLCELSYLWFAPEGGTILDPFAGGSVRGVVASYIGHAYTGIDLRAEQIDANRLQGALICKNETPPVWHTGDSNVVLDTLPDSNYDFLFSCPPYADLERYSDDPSDLSTMDYDEFVKVYRSIIAKACAKLKDNRFACFVVGDVRSKKTGGYRNFPGDTITAFMDAGLMLYNEAILVTSVGSLPIRTGLQFNAARKMGKTHQNILVFYKGDQKQIKEQFGPVV